MLVDFAVSNFRSYRGEGKLSLVAAKGDDSSPLNCITSPTEKFQLLRTAAIYGANASGKSNLILAMHQLANLLVAPNERAFEDPTHEPFRLDPTAIDQPSSFAVSFILDNVVYKYQLSKSGAKVHFESLDAFPQGRRQNWFARTGSEFDFNSTHLKGDKVRLQKVTAPSIPFLAVATAFDHPQLAPPAHWINTNLVSRSPALDFRGRNSDEDIGRLLHSDEDFHRWVNLFLSHADTGIQRVEVAIESRVVRRVRRRPDNVAESYVEDFPQEIYLPQFVHNGVDGKPVLFGANLESLGTRRLFRLLAPIYRVLNSGSVALMDEFSASMHPSMVRALVQLFQTPEINTKNAQLVFTAHDATLLNRGLFRRDQVWFTEKDETGATDLYSLQDIKGVRADEQFEKGYLQGKYGAIPFFSEFDFPEVCDGKAERSWQEEGRESSSESI